MTLTTPSSSFRISDSVLGSSGSLSDVSDRVVDEVAPSSSSEGSITDFVQSLYDIDMIPVPSLNSITGDLKEEYIPGYGNDALDLDTALDTLDGRYQENRDWAEEQAQKQMDFQTSANQKAMDFSAEQGELQRAWLEQMSNSSYQRAVEDMQKAGLNPILAYSQGGASTPSVSAASGVSSSGSQANMADTGYQFYNLLVDVFDTLANSATKVLDIGSKFSMNKANNATKISMNEANNATKSDIAFRNFKVNKK